MEEAAKEDGVHDEKLLDDSKFTKRMQLYAVSVPKHMSQVVARILSGYVLDMPRVKHIVPDPADNNFRLVILSEAITTPSLDGIAEEKLNSLKKLTNLRVVSHEIVLDYNYWPVEHILKTILPDEWEVPTSFETIGHIAHLNLRNELLPFRKIIAKVILDKNRPKIKTVVNKVNTIDNEFRVPTLEILMGENSLITEVKQHGAIFELDYGLVYWNSRLEHEHKRLISQFEKGQVVIDMFAGIGPFAVPAAQRGCIVFANDLNPDSVKYLQINAKINKVASRILSYNMDARHFIWKLMDSSEFLIHDHKDKIAEANDMSMETPHTLMVKMESLKNRCAKEDHPQVSANVDVSCGLKIAAAMKNVQNDREKVLHSGCKAQERDQVTPREHFDHVVMNLPASAIDFLDVFRGLLLREYWRGPMPRIHCYCFMRSSETKEGMIQRVERILGGSVIDSCVHIVRDVAPNKIMLCLSFHLPETVAFQETTMDRHNAVAKEVVRSESADPYDVKRARVM